MSHITETDRILQVDQPTTDFDRLHSCLDRYAAATGATVISNDVLEFLQSDNPTLTIEDEQQVQLTPNNFYMLLESTTELFINDDPSLVKVINNYAKNADVHFIESLTPEDEFSLTADRIEKGISSFIGENDSMRGFGLMNEKDITQICEIYNANNLLALASQIANEQPDGITEEHLEMLYRYRVVIHRLRENQEYAQKIKLAEHNPKETKDGERTWGGDIHPYGHRVGGVILGREFVDFSEREDDSGLKQVTVDGVAVSIKLSNRGQ